VVRFVYRADNPVHAYALKNFLEAQGIPAVVVGDGLFWMRGNLGMAEDTLPEVHCLEDEDAELARTLVERHVAPPVRRVRGWVRAVMIGVLVAFFLSPLFLSLLTLGVGLARQVRPPHGLP
jgi:hypothetical protein